MKKQDPVIEERMAFRERRGRYLERKRCARVIEDYIKAYPATLFPPTSPTREAIIGTGLRTMLAVVLKDVLDENRLS
jgi:hypothetical protein